MVHRDSAAAAAAAGGPDDDDDDDDAHVAVVSAGQSHPDLPQSTPTLNHTSLSPTCR